MDGRPDLRNDTARKILDAADELLAEVGLDGVSARSVATRAGVNNALVFYHFKSMRGLVERVLERYYEGQLAALEAATGAADEPLRARLHRVVDAYLDFMEAHRRFPRLVQGLTAMGPELHDLLRGHLAPLLRWAERALADVAPPEGPLAARHLFITFSGVITTWFTQGPLLAPLWGDDPEGPAALAERRAHVRWVVDALLAGLAREEPAGT
ncbi:MAG: TetR/AcrR family transcriptional regulator [Myxococcales bacterium]|nr:TetR/AcrR family transcriptional regulator [Myxococcales bacterium]MCB9734491.1 TetR/AcrR family transcriptional regulator [Deltaproteobacteria bacterium]